MPVFKSTAGNSGEGGDKLLPESERDTFSYLLACVKINKSIKQTEKILQFVLRGVRGGNKCEKPQAGLKGECVRDAGRGRVSSKKRSVCVWRARVIACVPKCDRSHFR